MTQEALELTLKVHRKNESHRTLAETRYWCEQYKLLAQQAIKALAQRTEQEPVAKYSDIVSDGGLDPRNTAQPQRTWVGLTDDELLEIYGWRKAPMLSDFIVEEAKQELLGALRKVEAKLKEKNT